MRGSTDAERRKRHSGGGEEESGRSLRCIGTEEMNI